MFKKYMTAGIVGSALLATAALAQSPSATTTTAPAAAPVTASDMTFNGNWRTSKVVGLSVYNEANESLGSINDLLTDKQGNIKAVVIGVGGFLGVGERLIAVPFDKIKFVNEPVATAASSTGGSSGMKSTSTPSGMTTGAATTGAAPAAATPAKANPWYPDHAVLSGASKDQLKAMPEFKYAT
ncbi:PRC-barrel domain-containing protein [Bradyrhizobium sp. NFR13]|uniref:PRC-barrel domain-containing protein n=1 Tax=Bradyrhizobium sp. NFR13 TaxID=1566285 RepID=UPI0008F30832|nr:PRC-barrel domain-containing protein [Bradyrhizobium sp. NFR13]SFM19129.1 PRC-barrel domain-containing protein [Bradyrhizobium sp. NFR13]